MCRSSRWRLSSGGHGVFLKVLNGGLGFVQIS
jgi:hypothetical protein